MAGALLGDVLGTRLELPNTVSQTYSSSCGRGSVAVIAFVLDAKFDSTAIWVAANHLDNRHGMHTGCLTVGLSLLGADKDRCTAHVPIGPFTLTV